MSDGNGSKKLSNKKYAPLVVRIHGDEKGRER